MAESARHSILREGLITGIIGATSVAVWFLIVDIVAGHPLYTPRVLGAALTSVLGPVPVGESAFVHIALYTVFHYIAFVAVGMLASVAIRWSETQPTVLAGFLILFVAIEIGFYALVAMLSEAEVLGVLAWYQVGAANLLSALLMGVYLWKRHPTIGRELGLVLEGGE